MASHALLKRMATNGALEYFRVTLVGEEPRACYDRVNLTDFFSGRTPDELLLSPRQWYVEHGIDFRPDVKVESIDRQRRILHTQAGDEIAYNHLVLATGSRPFVPPIDGTDLPGVFVYRTIEDVVAIREYASQCQRAAVLGGGLLGLEAGKALHDLNLKTHVLEVAPGLMPRQLNAEAAVLLKHEIEKLGVNVHVLRRAERIEQVGPRHILHLAGHDPLSVDMVVISAGIRPRDELARDAQLDIGPRGGVAVDAKLKTSDPNIFAIGECVSFEERLYGLVGPCYEMADVLADNLHANSLGAESTAEFTDSSKSSRLKLMGVDVATMGTPIGEARAATPLCHTAEHFCRTLLVERGRIIGAIGVGGWPERERLNGLIASGGRASQRQLRRFVDTGLLWSAQQGQTVVEWPATATVCSCLGITKGQLTDAIHAGATDPTMLAEATGASTVCGTCRPLLCELAGRPEASTSRSGQQTLLYVSYAAVATIVATLLAGPVPFGDSVQSAWTQVDMLWQSSLVRQVTGFTLLGVSFLALLLSLRRRWKRFSWGSFTLWRGIHGILGLATLVGFLVHTGMRMGHNFTFALAMVFLLLNLLGAFTGVAAALESRLTGLWGQRLRDWRPKLTQMHIWLFWPLPALVLFHVISVYYY